MILHELLAVMHKHISGSCVRWGPKLRRDEQEAIERALEENPEARAAMEEAQLRRIRASAAKELGNAAFKAGDFDDAIKRYSEAIEADNTDAAFYSNRCSFHILQCSFSLTHYYKSFAVDLLILDYSRGYTPQSSVRHS
jgi:tetratricopeptide (TPR) repeat protein